MTTTRRSAMAVAGAGLLGLTGCSAGEQSSSPVGGPSSSSSTTSTTEEAQPDPDRVALDRAYALTAGLLAGLAASKPRVDPAGRLADLHQAHLAALSTAAGSTAPSEDPAAPRGLTARALRRRELDAQRELAHLAMAADSGALARLLASMSAGIAAQLVAGQPRPGEVPG